MSPDTIAAEAARIAGAAHVLSGPDAAGHETDWTRRFYGGARFVVRPGDTAQVAALLRTFADAEVAVVPQGGNTGLVGGSVPRGGEAVLSLRRLSSLEIDASSGQATAGAGVTLEALQDAAHAAGFDFGVDLAARGSATVGGMVATNAGGIRVLRYGSMREQVLGLEAVFADGSVVSRMEGLPKDNTGYDLPALLTGSEGTLAVVTAIRLRLVPLLAARACVLLRLEGTAAAMDVALALRRACPSLESLEIFYPEGVALVCAHAGMTLPFATNEGAYLLAECAAHRDPSAELLDVLGTHPAVLDSAFATERPARAALWAYRERHTEAINAEGVPLKLDVAVPLPRVPGFLERARAAVAAAGPGVRLVPFGHLAEGNFHLNILDAPGDGEELTATLLGLVAAEGGSISSEHGIGVAKAPYLHLTRSAADIAAMRAIKRALDPRGVLNPGVIFAT